MPKKILVSIITPSYNRAWILQNCINSVKKQTYSNIEHIIIDSCSSDGTLQILQNNKKDYNLKWFCEEDDGMYDAINKGIKIAKGDIIAYLNTDDFYFSYAVEIVVREFVKHPDMSLIYGDWVTYYMDICAVEILPCLRVNKYDMARFACLPQPAVFVKREVFEQIGLFDTHYKLVADNEFFTRAVTNGFKLLKLDEILSGQIVHNDNLLAGNVSSNSEAEIEAARYRKMYWSEIEKEANTFDGRLICASIHGSLHSLIWRFKLIEFFLRRVFHINGKWDAYMRLSSSQPIDYVNLIRYIASKRKIKKYPYCIVSDFLKMGNRT